MSRAERLRIALFYAVGVVLLVIITTKHLDDILPNHLAHQISDNSEGYVIGLGACAWLQFAPRSRPTRVSLVLTVAGSLLCLALGLIFEFAGGLPVSVATLNEGWFALAFLIPYVGLPRPLRWAPVLSLVILVGLLAGHNTSLVVNGAEAWVVLVLAPLGFDVFDRAILEADAKESHLLRLLWMAILVAVPVAAVGLHHHLGHGHVAGIRDYISRANEAFVGVLIIHAYAGYWARSALARTKAASSAA
ncbi:MAG: hypothetical protein ACJ735_04260 [Actinomycetes bacterium]